MSPRPRGARLESVNAQVSIHAPCPPHLGAGTRRDPFHVVEVWLAVALEHEYAALMLRRVPEAGGFWQGVSGRVEREDRTYLDAAWRELAEETGLGRAGTRVFDLRHTMDFQGPVSGLWFRKWGVGLLLPEGTDEATVRLSDEHDAVRLMGLDEAAGALSYAGQASELRRFAERLPPLSR